LVVDADWITCAAHLYNLQDTAISQLLGDSLPVVEVRQIQGIRLDAPDEVRLGGIDNIHETGQLILELAGHRVLLFLLSDLSFLRFQDLLVLDVGSKHGDNKRFGALAHARDKVIAELILILVQEGVCAIRYWPCEVLDHEPTRLRLDLIEASVALVGTNKLVTKPLVGASRHRALLAEDGKDARCLRLQDVDGILVVWEIQRIPRDALAIVELLLKLEDELVEKLLQALICEIDTKLFEGVHLEALETKDIKHTHEELNIVEVADGLVGL